MLDAPAVGWVSSVLILLLGAIFFVLPCWVRLWQWRSEHHIITKACLLLLIPDLVMIVDFVPIHIRDLATGTLVDDKYCKASSYLICACILASNVGNITVAYVTRRMLDPKDQKVTTKTLYVSAAIGWTLGIALASYFLGQGYLGSHRGVYCCTNQVRRGDIAGPVFFVFAVCIAAMVYLYHTAYVQVSSVVMPSARQSDNERSTDSDGKGAASPRAGGANGAKVKAVMSARKPTPAILSNISGQKSSESMEAEETIATIATAQHEQLQRNSSDGENAAASSPTTAGRPAALNPAASPIAMSRSPPLSLLNSRPTPQLSAAQSIARRAILMVLAYYACWTLISLNAVFELAGWQDRSLWWDVVAAWASKLQPSIDAFILLLSMTKVHEKRSAMKQRNVESSGTAGRVQVKVEGSQILSKGNAMSPRRLVVSTAMSPSYQGKGRLISNGAVHPRATSPPNGARPPSPYDASARPLLSESPPPPSPAPTTDDNTTAEAEVDTAAAASNTVIHRRTASSEVVQYQ